MQRIRQFFMSTEQIYISTTYSFQPQATPEDLLQALFGKSKTSKKQMLDFINLIHTRATKSAIDRLRILSILNLLLLYNNDMVKYLLQILPLKRNKNASVGNFKKKKQSALGLSTNGQQQPNESLSAILNNNQDWLDENFIKPYELFLVKCTSYFQLYNASKSNRTWGFDARKIKDDSNCFRKFSNSCWKRQKGRIYTNSCEKDYKQLKSKNFGQLQSEANKITVVNFQYIFYLVNSIKSLLRCFQRINSLGHYFTRSVYCLKANAQSDLNSKLFVQIALMQLSDLYNSLIFCVKEMLKSPSKYLSKANEKIVMKTILQETICEINESTTKIISNKYFSECNQKVRMKLFVIDQQNQLFRTMAKSILRSKSQLSKQPSSLSKNSSQMQTTTNHKNNRTKSTTNYKINSSGDLFGETQSTLKHKPPIQEQSKIVKTNQNQNKRKRNKSRSKTTIDLSKLHLPSSKQLCQGHALGSSSNMKKLRYLQKLKLKKLSTLNQMQEEDIEDINQINKQIYHSQLKEFRCFQESTITNDSLGLSQNRSSLGFQHLD